MAPVAAASEGQAQRVPKVIRFEWGTFTFQGIVESYKETLDFFAADGVPLRGAVNLTLAAQDIAFRESDTAREDKAHDKGAVSFADAARRSPSGLADDLGIPGAARQIASQLGLESLRDTVAGAVSLRPERGRPSGPSIEGGPRGVFDGLRNGVKATVSFDPGGLTAGGPGVVGKQFSLGGSALPGSTGGLTADVGADVPLRQRLRFDGES